MGNTRPLVEFILQVINLVFTMYGLGTLGLGFICFIKYRKQSHSDHDMINTNVHRLLLAVDLQHYSISLPKAWFIYLIIGIGVILLIISCLGHVGTVSRNPCCLVSYCVFLVALILVELGTAAFIFFEHDWKEVIANDRSGSFHSAYDFLNTNWKVIRWVALVVFILQVIGVVLAVYLRSVYKRACYDSDEGEHVVYLSHHDSTNNYRRLTPTRSTPLTTTSANQ